MDNSEGGSESSWIRMVTRYANRQKNSDIVLNRIPDLRATYSAVSFAGSPMRGGEFASR